MSSPTRVPLHLRLHSRCSPGVDAPQFTPSVAQGNHNYLLSAIACGVALQLELSQPSFANSDIYNEMVLADYPADSLSLAPQPLAQSNDDLIGAIHALVADVLPEEWQKLPPNLASRVDETLYDREP
jgi:hypothetical protein